MQDKPANISRKELETIEKQLIKVNPKLKETLKGLNNNKKREILLSIYQFSIKESFHSGPIPDAESLKEYDETIPDGANRIMIMAEKQQEHRISIENKVISSQLNQSKRGQSFGLIIAIIGIIAASFLGYNDKKTVGGIIGGGTVISLVAVFVTGKRKQNKSLKDSVNE